MRKFKPILLMLMLSLSGCAYRLDIKEEEYTARQKHYAMYAALELEQRLLRLKEEARIKTNVQLKVKHIKRIKTYGKQKISATQCRR